MLITVTDRQSFSDVVAQGYGNVYALQKFIDDNIAGDFNLAAQMLVGKQYSYDIEADVANKKVLRKTDGKFFRTYNLNNHYYEGAEFNTDFNFDFTS